MGTEHFEPHAESTRAARTFVLVETGVEELVAERVALLVSELASNAVLHARTPYSVTASRRGSIVRVEVHDESEALPRMRQFHLDAPTGRGLHLIDKLASSWGVVPSAGGTGKTVWFEVDAEAAS